MLLLVEGELLDEKGLTQGVLQYMSAHLSSLTVSLPGVEVFCFLPLLGWIWYLNFFYEVDQSEPYTYTGTVCSLSRIFWDSGHDAFCGLTWIIADKERLNYILYTI